MKKRSIIAVMLVIALCLITIVPAYAQENGRIEAEQDRASVTLQCGLSHVSGSNYKLWYSSYLGFYNGVITSFH